MSDKLKLIGEEQDLRRTSNIDERKIRWDDRYIGFISDKIDKLPIALQLTDDGRNFDGYSISKDQSVLCLHWMPERDLHKIPYRFPTRLKNTDQILIDSITMWLERLAIWNHNVPDTDGSVSHGYIITNNPHFFPEFDCPGYDCLYIATEWIVYGK